MTNNFHFFAKATMMPPDANGPAGFTTQWHGHGANHQGNNNPGDTAADRHNFGNAEAGNSGHKPTAGSSQDDFSVENSLPLIPVENSTLDVSSLAEDSHDDMGEIWI